MSKKLIDNNHLVVWIAIEDKWFWWYFAPDYDEKPWVSGSIELALFKIWVMIEWKVR